jgi:ribosome-associated toxin RatA of RatAB toxin-antitoxin module
VKELQGRAAAEVELPVEDCFALLASIERYPSWFDVVRHAEILERDSDGHPLLARVELHVPQSPFGKDFELVVAIRTDRPDWVQFTKVPDDAVDEDRLELTWRMRANRSTEIEFEFDAAVSFLPGFLPLGGVGDMIAQTFLDAALESLATGTGSR